MKTNILKITSIITLLLAVVIMSASNIPQMTIGEKMITTSIFFSSTMIIFSTIEL